MNCNSQTSHVLLIDTVPTLDISKPPAIGFISSIYERVFSKLLGRKKASEPQRLNVQAFTAPTDHQQPPPVHYEQPVTLQTPSLLLASLPGDSQSLTAIDAPKGASDFIEKSLSQIQDANSWNYTPPVSSLPPPAKNDPVSDERNNTQVSDYIYQSPVYPPEEPEGPPPNKFQALELNGRRITTKNQLNVIKALITITPATRRDINKVVDALNIPDVISQLVNCNGWDIRSLPCNLFRLKSHPRNAKFYLLGASDHETALALIAKHHGGVPKLFSFG